MTDERIPSERFRALLDAYGADPRRWPESERKPALESLMASREARRLREEAARLDALLDSVPPMAPAPGLEQRIMMAAPQRASRDSHAGTRRRAGLGGQTGLGGKAGPGRFAASALAASLLLGFVAGTVMQPEGEGAEDGDFLQLAQLSDRYQDF